MIRFLRNVWRFRRELKTWQNDDWSHTEDLLLRGMIELRKGLHPHASLNRCIDILEQRQGWYYQTYKQDQLIPFKFESDGNYKITTTLTPEEQQHNKDIVNQGIALYESDEKYLWEQIHLYNKEWFL